jgi:hypothetical protein
MGIAAGLDVSAFCRHWRDSNGHLFTLERIEPDPERTDGSLLLHGTSSNCTCVERRIQHYGHDGPLTLSVGSAEDLSHGYVFGFDAEPQTHADLARSVAHLLSLDADEWSHVSRVIAEDEDFDDWVSFDVSFALRAIKQSTQNSHPDYQPTCVVHDMHFAGHTHAPLIAAALIARLEPGEAADLPTTLSESERQDLIERLVFLDALRDNTDRT